MKTITIHNISLKVKDYLCSFDKIEYPEKSEHGLWLYINLTDMCNAACPFCVNPSTGKRTISIQEFREKLLEIAPNLCGISITGGEPMLFPNLVDQVAEIVDEICGNEIELDLVTNGSDLNSLLSLKSFNRFLSVHISRHMVDDESNLNLMRSNVSSWNELGDFISKLEDPAKIVLNCVMQKEGVSSEEDVIAYLQQAADIGVRNVSFVGLIPSNPWSIEHYVSPASVTFKDTRFSVWNQLFDHEYCSCSSGDFQAQNGSIRYYFRCPTGINAEYCRQLVYTTDNRLIAGFGGEPII